MQQKKRHHFVPKAYLNAFCDKQGKLLVYRKDAPSTPHRCAPDATQFRRYYYSLPTPSGGQDNNVLEDFFSTVEGDWPETVARLQRRESASDRLKSIFEFIALQRVRVPASRDVTEAIMAQAVKDTLQMMRVNGLLPHPPAGLEGLVDKVQVSIDPHKSLHAMAAQMEAMGPLFSMLGLVAVHNSTALPFLTSDNPVLWFDPSRTFDAQQPYAIDPVAGPVLLAFPVSPDLILIGATDDKKAFDEHGLRHSDVSDEAWVEHINAQICRFAYESVLAQSAGQEDVIAKFAHVSPVHQAVVIPTRTGIATNHRVVFGPRVSKPKWRPE